MALLAEVQVFGWIGEPGTQARGGKVLFKDNYLAAGCQGSPGPKSSEGRYFVVLLATTVAGDAGRWDISPDGDHVPLSWVVEGAGATELRHQLLSVEVVPHSGGKTYLDNGNNLHSAGVESAINHLHSDWTWPLLLPQHGFDIKARDASR